MMIIAALSDPPYTPSPPHSIHFVAAALTAFLIFSFLVFRHLRRPCPTALAASGLVLGVMVGMAYFKQSGFGYTFAGVGLENVPLYHARPLSFEERMQADWHRLKNGSTVVMEYCFGGIALSAAVIGFLVAIGSILKRETRAGLENPPSFDNAPESSQVK